MQTDFVSRFGVFLTFIGPLLMAWEIFKPYRGYKYNDERDPLRYGLDPSVDGANRTKTQEYIAWKEKKAKLAMVGLFVFALGVFFQVL